MIQNFLNDVCHANINPQDVVDDNVLIYDKLFKHEKVFNSLIYRWVYSQLMKTEPSKLIINTNFNIDRNNTDSESIIIEIANIINDIVINTVLRFTKLNIPNTAKDLELNYVKYKANLSNNMNFVKNELFNMLLNRQTTNTDTFNPDKTLFSMFKSLPATEIPINTNPFTQCKLTPFTLNCSFNTVSEQDIVMNALAKDAYFSLKMSKYLIVGKSYNETNLKAIIKHYEPTVILGLTDNNPYTNYTISPGVASMISIYRPRCTPFNLMYIDDEPNITGITPFATSQCLRDCETAGDLIYKEVSELFYKPFFDLQLNNKVSSFHPIILEKLLQIFGLKHKQNKSLPENKSHHKNCLLAIDNRPNILTAISVYISRCALPRNDWNTVICTKPEHQHFYKSILGESSVEFITHKQQRVDEFRKFNQEDHNLIMKDPLLWQQIIKYDKCLTVQDDGILFKEGVEEFLKYDYVGAPWYINEQEIIQKGNSKLVGNGGLSLRTVQKMYDIAVSKKGKDENFCHNFWIIPEDVMYSSAPNLNIPVRSDAEKFAFEEKINMDAIGFHKPWAYCEISDIVKYLDNIIDKN